ncbi:MAG: hypothetical protein V4508_16920 [Pseudomonadota bacterium]
MRELARSNRAVLAHINGIAPAPDWPAATMGIDQLISTLASAPTPSPRNTTQRRRDSPRDATADAHVSNAMVTTQVSTEIRVSKQEVSMPVSAIDGRDGPLDAQTDE